MEPAGHSQQLVLLKGNISSTLVPLSHSLSNNWLTVQVSKKKSFIGIIYYNIPASFGNNGCKGGLMDNAFRYLETVDGDETEEEYPYLAEVTRSCLLIKITLMI